MDRKRLETISFCCLRQCNQLAIYDYEKGKYLTGNSDYIYSFSGVYPGDNPELIVYMAVKKPKDSNNYVAPAVNDIGENL